MRERNLQNWDRDPEIRDLLIQYEPGQVLLAGDLSQAEARVVAWLAREQTQIDLFQSGQKIHEYLGSIIMGQKITKKTHPREYETAKRICHGSNYGMSPKRMSEIILDELEIPVSIKECTRWQNVYFQTFPRIQTGYHMGIQEELRTRFCTITTPPMRMCRKFFGFWGDSLFREGYAHFAQNVVGFVTNNALNEIYYNSWLKPYLYMQVHDEVLLSVPGVSLDDAAHELRKAMTYTLDMPGGQLTIPVELKWGTSYGSMKDYEIQEMRKTA